MGLYSYNSNSKPHAVDYILPPDNRPESEQYIEYNDWSKATDVYYYVGDDFYHLGSLTALYNQYGNQTLGLSYDVWGRRTFTMNSMTQIERGFTGHRHVDELGLINMGGRVYDPLQGRFLSPDNYIQLPDNPQNYNRYSYCLNNPLKYTDPSGNNFAETLLTGVIDLFTTAFFKGGLDITSVKTIKQAWKEFDPTASWSKTNKSWKMSLGFYKTDSNKSFWQRAWEIASRFTWQSPQSFLGSTVNQVHNVFGGVKSVSFYGGATVIESYASNWGAFTIGSYINGNRGISANYRNSLFQHEYGHYLQSQDWGPLYLSKCAVPSLIDCAFPFVNHDNHIVEQDANNRALKYFIDNELGFIKEIAQDGSIDTYWDYNNNPILGYPSDILSLGYYDIIDIPALGLINTFYDTYYQIARRFIMGY